MVHYKFVMPSEHVQSVRGLNGADRPDDKLWPRPYVAAPEESMVYSA